MKIGIIGNGNHSKRIQKILQRKKINFFIYKPKKPKYFSCDEYKKLKNCNVIFIVSPNNSHLYYLEELNKNRYIFCEKPPVTSLSELKRLKKINHKKIYFNFNYRFSKISEILKNSPKYKLGNLLYANIAITHGLALKNKYKKSWRSDKKKCKKGVYEIISIHYIDLINFYYNIIKINKPKLINHSRFGTSFDTSYVELNLINKSIVNIFSSYCSPYTFKLFFLFKNGVVKKEDNKITIQGPAINLDSKGFFKSPKIIKQIKTDDKKDYEESLKKSVTYFLNCAKKRINFRKKLFSKSLESNEILLKND